MNPIEAIQSANETAIEATMLSNNTAIEVKLDENNTPIQVLTNYNPSIVTSIRFAKDTAPMVGDVVINDLSLLDVQAQFNNVQEKFENVQEQITNSQIQLSMQSNEISRLADRATSAESEIGTIKIGLNTKLTTPNGSTNQFMFRNGANWIAQSPLSVVEANAGSATTARTVSAAVLKNAIQTHQIQPNWNSTSGKGAILNKPDLSVYALKSELSQLSGSANAINIRASSIETADSGLRIEAPDDETAIVEMGPTMKEAWQNAIGLSAIQPASIYGMVRGRVEASAQVLGARVTVDMYWDESRKLEQNIRFLGEADSNAWLIPEDGIYTLTASAESVDVPNPFALFFRRRDLNGTWGDISPEVFNSYPANGRGCLISTTQHFRKGELVNVQVVNASDGSTRIGEHDWRGHAQCYYTITRVATFGTNTLVSPRPSGRLFKKVNARISVLDSSNKSLKFSFDVPQEFRGRKFKATFKLVYDYSNLNNTDRPRAVTEVFRKDWNGSSYLVDKLLFRKHTNGFHNYFELTELYELTSDLQVMDIILRDRDNVSPNQAASQESCVFIETVD